MNCKTEVPRQSDEKQSSVDHPLDEEDTHHPSTDRKRKRAAEPTKQKRRKLSPKRKTSSSDCSKKSSRKTSVGSNSSDDDEPVKRVVKLPKSISTQPQLQLGQEYGNVDCIIGVDEAGRGCLGMMIKQ